ncbi:MAG: ribose 5-phosphate isomerase B [Deltaproteobacteria bacterium]|nr:ribose 5-phosphate isomerase B [Deltaproteobacteria bacterium]
MKIAFGADHAGFHLKNHLVSLVRSLGHEVEDFGTFSESSVDYPDFAVLVAEAVETCRSERGVLICGSGVGMSIAANRFSGVRAVLALTEAQARLARGHNDANVLCLGARLSGVVLAEDAVRAFLSTAFEGGRHVPRVAKLSSCGVAAARPDTLPPSRSK